MRITDARDPKHVVCDVVELEGKKDLITVSVGERDGRRNFDWSTIILSEDDQERLHKYLGRRIAARKKANA